VPFLLSAILLNVIPLIDVQLIVLLFAFLPSAILANAVQMKVNAPE